MPELPEVETIATQLNLKLSGKRISAIDVFNGKSFDDTAGTVIGDTVTQVSRRAKTLIFSLKSGLYLLVHLKMTGQLIYQDDKSRVAGGHPSHDFHASLPNSHTRLVIHFGDKDILFFNDLRKFGWVRVANKEEFKAYFSKFGPDAVSKIDLVYLKKRAERMPRLSVKKFILDQNVISGVGNIYADESLFEARIHPETLVSELTDQEWVILSKAITEKLKFAVLQGGTTDNDYVNAFGEKGGMQNYLNVYHKTGEPCPRDCGGKIERIKVAGRGTHFCPVCQRRKP